MIKKSFLAVVIIVIFCILSACSGFGGQGIQAFSGSLSISQSEIEIHVGETAELKVEHQSKNSDVLTFSSSDASVAEVDFKGIVKAKAPGTAAITVTVGKLSSVCNIKVTEPPVKSILFDKEAIELTVGEKYKTAVTFLPEFALDEECEYSSSDERIVTVDNNGEISAVGVGDAKVTVSLKKDSSISCSMDVVTDCDTLTSLRFEKNYYFATPDTPLEFSFITEPYGMTVENAEWTSSNNSVVRIDENSNAVAGRTGISEVTVSADGAEAKCFVGVGKRTAYEPLSEITDPRYSVSENNELVNENAAKSTKAAIMLTGDLMCLSAQQNAARVNGSFDFNSSFSIVKDIFAKSDFCMGNMETLTSHSNSYTHEKKDGARNPNCNAPSTYLDALRYAGFDALALANNHAGDGGMTGVFETREQLEKYKLYSTGMFETEDERRYMIVDVNGIKVGIVSYTGHVNDGAGKIPSAYRKTMMNYYSIEKAEADIAAMKADGAEYIITYMHWGTENTHTVNSSQKNQAKALADAGSDLIAGSHPHCLQPAELITSADGREVMCMYSLGNFVSSMGSTINNDTVILNVDLERINGKIESNIEYIACRVIGTYQDGKYVVVPVSSKLNDGAEISALESARTRINRVMGDDIAEKTEF